MINNDNPKVRLLADAVRVTATEKALAEITDLANAALLDLKRQGVNKLDIDDPLIFQAVKLYVKGHYGYDKDSARFDDGYRSLSAGIALCDEYREESESNG